MEKAQAKLESLKMIKEWSTSLIVIQTAICAFLWNVLKERGLKDWPSISLHCGWFAFSVSVIIATILLSSLPGLIENVTEDNSSGKSVFISPLNIMGTHLKLKTLMFAEHVCFLLGILFVIIFVITRPMI